MDNINLDIHTDLVEAGQEYLKVFDTKKVKRLQDKKSRKQEILRLMKELEDMISVIGADAMGHRMQIYTGEQDPEKEEERLRQKELRMNEERDRVDEEQDRDKREKMMEDWSQRDKNKLDETKAKMQEKGDLLKKELAKQLN